MPIRFRKTIKILPGVKMNLSKGGVSFTFGSKGYHVNVGKRGVRQTVGIPGTGLSYVDYPDKDDDDKDKKSGEKDGKKKEGIDLPEAAMMAMAANAMTDKDDDNDTETKSERKTRTKRKRTYRREPRPRRYSSTMLSFVFLGVLVFFCVGAAVLGLIPSDFVNNLGHTMVLWAQQFGR